MSASAMIKSPVQTSANALTMSAMNLCARGRKYYRLAYDLLSVAARDGDPEAQYAIGTWCLFGRLVPKNPPKAVTYFKKAARKGHAAAMYDLAVSYEKGIGTSRSYPDAFRWYLASAKRGDGQAQEEVARCYYYGIGTRKNTVKYQEWTRRHRVKPKRAPR